MKENKEKLPYIKRIAFALAAIWFVVSTLFACLFESLTPYLWVALVLLMLSVVIAAVGVIVDALVSL